MSCEYDIRRMNLPLVSDLLINDRNYSRKVDYMNVCEKLQLGIKHEKVHPKERSYEYKNVNALSDKKDHLKFPTLEQPFECNKFGKVLHDNTFVCVIVKSSLTRKE